MSCGAHLTLFTTGRGSVVGSAVAPVIKITGNPETFARMGEDMDIDAGRIMLGDATLDAVGEDIFDLVLTVAGGAPSKSETLGHREFILGYKSIEAVGPACHPGARRSEERRVGKECGRTGGTRWSRDLEKKKRKKR